MNLPYVDRIWRIRGFISLDKPQPASAVFDRLKPLLDSSGTIYEIDGDTLAYANENPAAQDKLATFNSGILQVDNETAQPKLRYDLVSPALKWVFLAPLMFLFFAQAMVVINTLEKPTEEEVAKAEAEAEEEEEEEEAGPMNPIDQWLGAPTPETLEEKKRRMEEEEEKTEGELSPTPAYVLAGIFGVLFIVGRILEPWLLRRSFKRALFPELSEGKASVSANGGPGSQG